MTDTHPYGVMARFADAEALLQATKAARQAGYQRMDAYTPFPVPGLSEALGFRERRIAPVALGSGTIGSVFAFTLQWYSATIDYPYLVGGKPLNSWPAFLPITFEVGILTAVLAAVVAMLVGNGLPRPYHPAFNERAFERASSDGFFLLLCEPAPQARAFLEAQTPLAVLEVTP
ncbi:DUF3341 domain-containing protein [Marinimicrobium locisalis]|uniref:DUF3341 domain-containing protein n=1 Tax=Marinimicrobium locisalis TaxID=546022 RepID=UPI003221C2FA